MIWTPSTHAEKYKEIADRMREEFIQKAKNADPGFVAMMEMKYESPEFETYPEEQKQTIKDFIEARKL